MIAPEQIAGLIVGAAAVVMFVANPLARWWARGEAALDGLIEDALDPEPDYDANVIAFDRLGVRR